MATVTIQYTVLISVYTHANTGSRRRAGKGNRVVFSGRHDQANQVHTVLVTAISTETGIAGIEIALLTVATLTLGNKIALADIGTRRQQLQARQPRNIAACYSHLLTDDRGQVARERHHKLLDLAPLVITRRTYVKTTRVRERATVRMLERDGAQEPEYRVDTAIMEETESTNLLTRVGIGHSWIF